MSKTTIKLNYNIIIIFLLFFIVFFCILNSKSNYEIRISIKEEDFSTENMDNIFALNLTKEFLNLKSIKNIATISSKEYCNIYLKLNFSLNKISSIQKIKIILDDFISKTNLNPEIDFDFDYDKNYDYFLIFYDKNNIETNLAKSFDITLNKLTNSKVLTKIFEFEKQETLNTIYFKNSTLLNFDITPTEIKNIIRQNNFLKNSSKQENTSSYFVNFNSNIKNISDIKSLTLHYKNKNFCENFDNIFKIKEEKIFSDDFSVYFNDNKANLLALKKNKLIPKLVFEFLIKNKLKKLNFDDSIEYRLFDTSKLSKIEIYNEDYLIQKDLIKTKEFISKEFKNQIYFLKCDNPRISKKDIYKEINNNKIVILTTNKSKLKSFLDKNNINFKNHPIVSKKENVIVYNYNNSDLSNYFLNKEESTESLLANNGGLVCDCYFDGSKRIKIILKNSENSEFIYSKKYKALIHEKMLSDKSSEERYVVIVRKNGNKI